MAAYRNDARGEVPGSLKHLLIGGEALTGPVLENFLQCFTSQKPPQITNVYGPTESTVDATSYDVSYEAHTSPDNGRLPLNIPIGKPMPNISIIIRSPYKQLQPVRVPGELCIAGAGMAVGYLNQPELTAEKFEPSMPRLYHTGDLACWLEDGNIRFLGRIDQQVKVRGFRVELGEVEACLTAYEGIREAVVVLTGQDNLCAYYVPVNTNDGRIDSHLLKNFLSRSLPDYMIPAYFVDMDRIPLTVNGKVNRSALPLPDVSVGSGYVAPRDDMDTQLVVIWSEVLGLEREGIGIEHNFFELGGHSLKATVLVSLIHQQLDVRVPLAEVFRAPDIKQLSQYIKNAVVERFVSIKACEKKEYYNLSSAQRRLYIIQQMDLESTAYNMPETVELAGRVDIRETQRYVPPFNTAA